MSNIPGTTRLQTKFLRSFLRNPAGPPPQDWPAPALLRRWLRRPTFRAAFTSLRKTARLQLATQTLLASLASAQHLHAALESNNLSPEQRRLYLDLLKLVHPRRSRPAARKAKDESDDLTFEEQIDLLKHPSVPLDEAVAFFKSRLDGKWQDPEFLKSLTPDTNVFAKEANPR